MYDIEYIELMDKQTEIMIEEEKIEQLFTKIIRMFGFEHTNTITFAWYVDNANLQECERVYQQLIA